MMRHVLKRLAPLHYVSRACIVEVITDELSCRGVDSHQVIYNIIHNTGREHVVVCDVNVEPLEVGDIEELSDICEEDIVL